MTSIDGDFNQNFQDAIDVIQQHSNNPYYDSEYSYHETLTTVQQPWYLVHHPSDAVVSTNDWSDTTQQSWTPALPDVPLSQSLPPEPPHFYPIPPPPQSSKDSTGDCSVPLYDIKRIYIHGHQQVMPSFTGQTCGEATIARIWRKKLRLYEYLHQALNDPNMCDSIQWTDSGSGTFHFISKNKEKLAECWGQRKGNRKTMTYQKMARALRNYSRTGEIIKVRRKLTYQFNPDILHRLGSSQVNIALPREAPQQEHCTQQQNHGDQGYTGFPSGECHSWYGHYLLSEDYDLCPSYTAHSCIKS